ncbi:MAG TPA: LytR C-terminal domain-containing protein, partial [Acidimicrobiales bacterium]
FSPKDIVRLAGKFKSLDPESVEMIPIPTIQTRVGQAAVLKLKQPDADEALARFRGELPQAVAPTTVPNILPSTVRVRVQNGSGIDGQASDVAAKLRDEGFATAGAPGDADSAKYLKSLIKYPPGGQEKAKLLQAYLGGASTLQEDRSVRDLVLVTGAEFTGIRAPNAPPPPTTSTTASAKGTTTTAPAKAAAAPASQPAC